MTRKRDHRGDTKPLPPSFGRVLGQRSVSFSLEVPLETVPRVENAKSEGRVYY